MKIPGTPVLNVTLRFGSDDLGPVGRGYAIGKEVEEQTDGTVKLGPGTLYRLLKKLTDDGWIVEIEATDDEHERRRTYRLTPRGRAIAQAEARRLDALVTVARSRRILPALAGR